MLATLAAGTTVTVPLSETSTFAYPEQPNGCNDSTIKYAFTSDPASSPYSVPWSLYPTRQGWVEDALAQLNSVRGIEGNPLQSITKAGFAQAYDVGVELHDDPGNLYGSSSCYFGATMWINSIVPPSTPSQAAFYWQIGQHEMMHLAGANHSAKYDDSTLPRMATCLLSNEFRNSVTLNKDDRGEITWLHDGGTGNRVMTSNAGFENNQLTDWSKTAGTWAYKSYGAQGPNGYTYASWNSGGQSSSRYVNNDSNVVTGNSNESYHGIANVMANSSSYKSTARLSVWFRTKTYLTGGDPNCNYADNMTGRKMNLDPEGYGGVGPWVERVATGTVTLSPSAWTPLATTVYNPPTTDGFVMRIRLEGAAQNTSNSAQFGDIYFDSMAVIGT